VDTSMVPEADIVIGGPPCQGFSSLGLQDTDDPRNKLWAEYTRIVQASGANVFVIENVDRFIKSGEFELLKHEVESGALSDFEIAVGVLDAADYGVAQRRKRTIIIGSRIGRPSLPMPTHAKEGALFEAPWQTVRDALKGVRRKAKAPDSLPATKSEFFGRKIGGPYSMSELHFGRNPTQLSLDRYRVIPPGGGRHDLARERPDLLPPCWRNKPEGTVDVMGRLQWSKPSVTIRTEFFKPEKGRYLHPEWSATAIKRSVDRVITHREAALIQGFPQHFRWCGSKSEIARQIGNAVPPPLAEAIASAVQGLFDAELT